VAANVRRGDGEGCGRGRAWIDQCRAGSHTIDREVDRTRWRCAANGRRLIDAVSNSELPAEGVVVAGLSTMVGELLGHRQRDSRCSGRGVVGIAVVDGLQAVGSGSRHGDGGAGCGRRSGDDGARPYACSIESERDSARGQRRSIGGGGDCGRDEQGAARRGRVGGGRDRGGGDGFSYDDVDRWEMDVLKLVSPL